MVEQDARFLRLIEKVVSNPVVLSIIFRYYGRRCNIFYGDTSRANLYEKNRTAVDPHRITSQQFDCQLEVAAPEVYKFRTITKIDKHPMEAECYGYVKTLPEGFKSGSILEYPLHDSQRLYFSVGDIDVINGISTVLLYRLVLKPWRF